MVKAFGKTSAYLSLIGPSLVLAVFLLFSGCNRDQSAPSESTTTTVAAPAATVPVPTTLVPSPSSAPPAATTVPPAPAKTATTPETTTTTSPVTATSPSGTTRPAAPPTTTAPPAPTTSPGNYSRVQVGMTTQQVQQFMGSPDKAKQKKNGMLEWEYYTGQGKFEVYFQNDKVVSSRMH